MKNFSTLALWGLISASSLVAHAQQGESVRVRGSVTALGEDLISVQTASGQNTKVALDKDYRVLVYSPIKVADITPNAYVAVASSPRVGGGLQAMGVVVLPQAMRGMNEGSMGWDLTPGSRMTNATVGQINQQGTGEITVRFGKGEEQKMQLTERTRFATFAFGDAAAVTVGAKVVVFATKEADGTVKSGVIGVGKDGYVPPL